MGYFGTLVLAKPSAATLPAQPRIQQWFGSRWNIPDVSGLNELGLYDLGQGWQRVGVHGRPLPRRIR